MNGLFLKKDGSEGFSVATRPYFHSTMRTHAMGRRGTGGGQVQLVGGQVQWVGESGSEREGGWTDVMGRREKGDGQVQWVGEGRGMDKYNNKLAN